MSIYTHCSNEIQIVQKYLRSYQVQKKRKEQKMEAEGLQFNRLVQEAQLSHRRRGE